MLEVSTRNIYSLHQFRQFLATKKSITQSNSEYTLMLLRNMRCLFKKLINNIYKHLQSTSI